MLTGTLPAEYRPFGERRDLDSQEERHKRSPRNGFQLRPHTENDASPVFATCIPPRSRSRGTPMACLPGSCSRDANVGGPIVIRRCITAATKRSFFFGYQKLIEKKTQAYTSQTPSPDMLNGDFTFGGLGQPLYDPLTTRQNADGSWLAINSPNPSDPVRAGSTRGVESPLVQSVAASEHGWVLQQHRSGQQFTYNPPSRTFYEDYSGRVDHQFNQNVKIYGSYTYNHNNGLQRPTTSRSKLSMRPRAISRPIPHRTSPWARRSFSGPTTLNEVRVSFLRPRNDMFVPTYTQTWGATLGIPNISPALMPRLAPPALGSGHLQHRAQVTPRCMDLPRAAQPEGIRQTISLRDDFSENHGRTLSRWIRNPPASQANYWQLGQPAVSFNSDNMTAGLRPSGNPVPSTWQHFAAGNWDRCAVNFSTYTTHGCPRDVTHGRLPRSLSPFPKRGADDTSLANEIIAEQTSQVSMDCGNAISEIPVFRPFFL